MSEIDFRRHGLESFLQTLPQDVSGDSGTGMTIQIQAALGHINLRGNPEQAAFVSAAADALGQPLPVIANTMTFDQHRIYWLGPNEWLILTAQADTPALITRMRTAMLDLHAWVTDLSGGQMALRMTGPHARTVLAKGCTLNFHADEFKPGCCAQSGLAKANVLIGLVSDEPVFEIVVRRSFVEYLARWMQQAADEYCIRFSTSE